ncbi:MAG: hypothetical protein ACE5E4_03075 [Candidatus Binatia bacterium]
MKVRTAVLASLLALSLVSCASGGSGRRLTSQVAERYTVAILPFAWAGAGGGRACELCPEGVVMQETSRHDALLVTAFFYEQLTRYPRFAVLDYAETKVRPGEGMRAQLQRLSAAGKADAFLVGGLLALRHRRGNAQRAVSGAGASIYAALIDADNGRRLWSELFDEVQRPSRAWASIKKLTGVRATRWLTALEFARHGVREMVSSLARQVGA